MKSHGRLRALPVLCCLSCISWLCCAAQQASEAQGAPPTIELNVNRILVPVVVRDKAGRAVVGLKQDDFRVFDNGKPHAISALSVEKRGAPATSTPGSPESSAQPSASQTPQPQRFIVFLFDDLHLNFEDLAHAQKAGVQMLDREMSPTDLAAVVSTSGMTDSGFTADPGRLHTAIMSLRPRTLYQPAGNAGMTSIGLEPNPGINRLPDRSNAITPAQVLAEQDRRVTFASIAEFVRAMAALPGQRTLILVSPGFVIPPDDNEARSEESRVFDLAARFNVTISALDARGLVAGGSNQSPDQQDVMSELANATGGTFFHNSNDLNAGFKSLTETPETVYLLELSLDGIKADGSYHRLKVKVRRDGVDLQARRGYFIPKPEKKK